jgi:hypothetical protein
MRAVVSVRARFRTLFIVVSVLVALGWFSSTAFAQGDIVSRSSCRNDQSAWATVSTERLNVRAGPSTVFSVITSLSRGASASAEFWNHNGTWVQLVLRDGRTGWVYAPYVSLRDRECLWTLHIVPKAGYTGLYDIFAPFRECADFRDQREAQSFYISSGGPRYDIHGLDTDGNGLACDDYFPILWTQARNYVGSYMTVCGPVARTNHARTSQGSPTFIDLGNGYPSTNRFTIVIWGQNRSRFTTPPEQLYSGKRVCVTGLIDRYEGVPEIEVTSPVQIRTY